MILESSHFDLAKYSIYKSTIGHDRVKLDSIIGETKRNERRMGSLGQTSTSMDHRRFLWWRAEMRGAFLQFSLFLESFSYLDPRGVPGSRQAEK
jgi:hypothetical protein